MRTSAALSESRGPPAEVLVDFRRGVRDLLREREIDIYNGSVCNELFFPRIADRGIVAIMPTFEAFTTDMKVSDAHAIACKPGSACDLWSLVACAHLQAPGKKIFAFGAPAEIDGISQFPYIGFNGGKRYIGLTRMDFHVEAGDYALHIKQVMVR